MITTKIPQKTKYILVSDLDGLLHQELCDQYHLTGESVGILAGIIGDLLYSRLTIPSLEARLKEKLSLPSAEIAKLANDIVGQRLFVLDDEFGGMPEQFLQARGVDPKKYQSYVDRQEKMIATEQAREVAEQLTNIEPEFVPKRQPVTIVEHDPEIERQDALEIFGGKLVKFFDVESIETAEIIADYNLILIELLDSNPQFKSELEQALARNQELLTSNKITISGTQTAPTIANWLQDFISVKGSNFFDNLVLSEYITNSLNTRSLTEVERGRLTKLLQLYRTIKFFPSTFIQAPSEQWQVIPISLAQEQQETIPKLRIKKVVKDPVEQQLQQLMAEYDLKNLTGIEQRALLDQYHITQEQFKNFIQNNG
jgi:hypothetical protein